MTTPEQLAATAAQRQLDAYNARDLDAFVACYHPEVRLHDLRSGEVTGQGHDSLRAQYGELFESRPNLHAAVVSRSVVGRVVFDREVVTGHGQSSPLHAMAVYEVDDEGLIVKVWFVVA